MAAGLGLVVSGLRVRRASTACGASPPGGMDIEQAGFRSCRWSVCECLQGSSVPLGFWCIPSRCVGRAWKECQRGQRGQHSLTMLCRPVPLRAPLLGGQAPHLRVTGSQIVLPAAVSQCDGGASVMVEPVGGPEAPAWRGQGEAGALEQRRGAGSQLGGPCISSFAD